ncbi:MAG: response regulator [Anaerolineae bacterium]|nr:response regulator [Anaerolineae bacterium]
MTYQIDVIDQQIIRSLQDNGRKSNVDIARQVGVTEATIRKRLDRLLSERIIHPTISTNLAQIGLSTGAMIALQVDLTFIGQIAEQLANLPQVRSVCYTTGEYDLFCEAVFASDQDLLYFLTNEIAAIDGIRKTSTFHILRRIKDECQWTLPTPSPTRVLIVDDDPDFVEATRIVLEASGFQVVAAASGDNALDLLHRVKPAVIIMDIMMQGILDGLNASWQIQADPELKNVPILVVSSIADSDYAEMFPTEGHFPADRFLSKPVSPDVLIKEVKRFVE